MANKTGKGGFKPGASGNPGGGPKAASIIALEARKHGLAMVSVLNTLARRAKSEQVRVAAANSLLDRAYGRPSQSVELNFTASLLQKKLTEMSPDELRVFEERVLQISGAGADGDDDSGDDGGAIQLPLGDGDYNGAQA